MLVKGELPRIEPIISIGIVLPNDKQNSIEIISHTKKKKYYITVKNKQLLINDSYSKYLELKNSTSKSFFTIGPIPAGRGFHWEKKITIKVVGNLTVFNRNGFLFIINEIELEKYLMCVATSEMSGNCPSALLEAQTIAARSWIIAAQEQKHANLGIDACNDDCCQRYQGIENLTEESKAAALKTRGIFLTFNNRICDTRYSKSCGGISENNENVWDEKPKPYLRGVFDGEQNAIPDLKNLKEIENWIKTDPECYCSDKCVKPEDLKKYIGKIDKIGNYFRWEFTYSKIELKDMINKKRKTSYDVIISIKPLKRGISGRITKLAIKGMIKNKTHNTILTSEYEIRRVLHNEFLYSSAFIVITNLDANNNLDSITLKGAGWGHGVGLCQIGALGMALQNKSTENILSHYFLSTTLIKLYD